MKTLVLAPVKGSAAVFSRLEKRGLVRMLRPTRALLGTRTRTGAVDVFYAASPAHGSHMLLGVGKRSTEIELSSHPGNEDLLLVNPTSRRYKPLYLIVALDRREEFERKARAGRLRAADLLAVELEYNDPATCVFTVCAGTVHCEVTVPGRGQHPVFYVTEPSSLPMQFPDAAGYRFALKNGR